MYCTCLIFLSTISFLSRPHLTRVKANFLIWNIAYRFTGDISPDYENVRHRFVVAMYGKQQRKSRWRECVSSTSAAVSMAVGKLFVEEHFDENSKIKASSVS